MASDTPDCDDHDGMVYVGVQFTAPKASGTSATLKSYKLDGGAPSAFSGAAATTNLTGNATATYNGKNKAAIE